MGCGTFAYGEFNDISRVIQRHLVFIGTVNSALVYSREYFRPSILVGVTSVIVVIQRIERNVSKLSTRRPYEVYKEIY